MRNLGDIICVKVITELLRRIPSKEGRPSYTLTEVTPVENPGEWLNVKMTLTTDVNKTLSAPR